MTPLVPLGKTEFEITRVGLGAAIHHAVEAGVNWIDTAPAYGLGRAEEVVGEAVRQLPDADRPLIFTKCGLVWKEGERTVSNSLASASIRRECEDSLRRLGVDTLDLLQAHWPTEDGTALQESWATMAALVDEGKVRHIGLSNFSVDDLELCETIRHVDTFQPQLNLLVRDALSETIPWCAARGTGVIVYSPMRSGLLSGRFTAERAANLPDDDWRKEADDFKPPKLELNLDLVERLQPIADRLGASLPELSIAWTLAQPGVTGAIVGARTPDQVDGWIASPELSLGDKDLEDIRTALTETGAGEGPIS
jgi:aryl-alcohol dehydrogenase-like predicted oxidoreductase